MGYVYIIRTQNYKLYIGHTNNLDRREFEHHYHKNGAKFLKANKKDFQIVYTEQFNNLLDAVKREKQLKGWTRAKKEALIAGNLEALKQL